MQTFGDRILLALKDLGKTQGWLAKAVGVPDSRISEWVGGVNLKLDSLEPLVRVLADEGVSAEYLMLGRGPVRRTDPTEAQGQLEVIRELIQTVDGEATEVAELVRSYLTAKRLPLLWREPQPHESQPRADRRESDRAES